MEKTYGTEVLNRIRDEHAELYTKMEFKDNPDGFHVSPWCNEDTMSDAFSAGFNAAAKELWPVVEQAKLIYLQNYGHQHTWAGVHGKCEAHGIIASGGNWGFPEGGKCPYCCLEKEAERVGLEFFWFKKD